MSTRIEMVLGITGFVLIGLGILGFLLLWEPYYWLIILGGILLAIAGFSRHERPKTTDKGYRPPYLVKMDREEARKKEEEERRKKQQEKQNRR